MLVLLGFRVWSSCNLFKSISVHWKYARSVTLLYSKWPRSHPESGGCVKIPNLLLSGEIKDAESHCMPQT